MIVELIAVDTEEFIEELELPFAPRVGEFLAFDENLAGIYTYKVIAVSHCFARFNIGTYVKTPEVRHMKVVCIVQEVKRGG